MIFGGFSTYPLVEVDGVLARHHILDGGAGLLAGVCGGHCCKDLLKGDSRKD